jgi:uncharacterized protein YacL
MLGFIMSIVMILFGEKLVITPTNQLEQQFPKMPLTTVAKIVGGIASILGISIFIAQILLYWEKYMRKTHIEIKAKTETG